MTFLRRDTCVAPGFMGRLILRDTAARRLFVHSNYRSWPDDRFCEVLMTSVLNSSVRILSTFDNNVSSIKRKNLVLFVLIYLFALQIYVFYINHGCFHNVILRSKFPIWTFFALSISRKLWNVSHTKSEANSIGWHRYWTYLTNRDPFE